MAYIIKTITVWRKRSKPGQSHFIAIEVKPKRQLQPCFFESKKSNNSSNKYGKKHEKTSKCRNHENLKPLLGAAFRNYPPSAY